LTVAFAAAALAAPAVAQNANTTQPAHRPPVAQTDFPRQQNPDEWRATKLVGASVYGPDNASIGTINDLVFDRDGSVKAAVVGVGGFLGIGEKSVAIPFRAMQIQRKPNTTSIEKVTVGFTRQQLTDAPKFLFLQANEKTTTGNADPKAPAKGPDRKPAGK
jgi:sporulation protein YlmC with PRC-barrel domain